MSFAHPAYLDVLWLLPLLVLLRWWAERQGAATAASMVAKRLRDLLMAGASPVVAWLMFALQLIALAAFVAALAQPRWGEEKKQVSESGRNVLLAIDTSKSMLADDVSPNRLMRAKLAAQDMVETLREQRVGLIAFAGRAYLQAPLTTDHAAVVESLQALDTYTIPLGGTAISEALREALEAFSKTKARSHGLIIFSDGGEEDSALDGLLERAKQKNVTIISVGVGTDTGALIPDPDPDRQGNYIRDPATGNPVHSHLEEATLQKLAAATNGRYLRLGQQGLSHAVVMQVLSGLESMETGSHEESKPIERFYWPLLVGIVALMLSLSLRPAVKLPRLSPTAVGLLLLCLTCPAQAAVLSLSQTVEQAEQAYRAQDYSRARDLYARLLAEKPPEERAEEYSYGLGASAHQLKDYDRAVESFSRALRSPSTDTQWRSHQSLGNALYEQGAKALQQQPEFTLKAWGDSVSHYESALAMKEDVAVRENYEFVKRHLKQLKEQEQQKQDQQKKEQQQKQGDKEKQDKQQQGQQKGDKDQNKEGQQGKDNEEEQQDGQKQDGKEGKDQQGKQGKGQEQEAKDGEQIPEGPVKAGESGQPDGDKQAMQQELAEQKPDERTGFSKNEARSLLRAYSDQMQLQFQQRQRERQVKKDW